MRTMGVLPTASRTDSMRRAREAMFLAATRDRGDDADLVACLQRGAKTVEEAHVLFAHIQVHEAANALVVHQAVLDAGVVLLQILDEGADGLTCCGDLVLAAGEGAERCGDANLRCHD